MKLGNCQNYAQGNTKKKWIDPSFVPYFAAIFHMFFDVQNGELPFLKNGVSFGTNSHIWFVWKKHGFPLDEVPGLHIVDPVCWP